MGLNMPKAEIMFANSGNEPRKEAHERMHGPWDNWEIEDAARHMDRAHKIMGNPKFMEAITKHHEAKAKEHHEMVAHMKPHMKRGLVSEKALEKASNKRG